MTYQRLPVPGYEGLYADTDGKLWTKDEAGFYRKKTTRQNGYKFACGRSVHSLILLTFCGPRPDGYHGCHNNGVRTDNRLSNLRWGTPKSNSRDLIWHAKLRVYKKYPGARTIGEIARGCRSDPSNIANIISRLRIKTIYDKAGALKFVSAEDSVRILGCIQIRVRDIGYYQISDVLAGKFPNQRAGKLVTYLYCSQRRFKPLEAAFVEPTKKGRPLKSLA